MDRFNGAPSGSAGSPMLDVLDGIEPNQSRGMEGSPSIPNQWNIIKFYAEADAPPWTPLGMARAPPVSLHDGHARSPMISNQAGSSGYAWQGYRSSAPSDGGTVPLPSDSGYSSQHPRPGMDTASICTGGVSRDQDLQGVTGHFSRAMDAFGQESLDQNQDVIGQMGAWRDQAPSKLWCAHCQKVVKTRSELKKHEQRHEKPFVCRELDCPRKQQGKLQGFSTKNDLERHKKTVHNKPAGVHYRCHLDQCKTKTKLWPRADNFRSHLKRIHNKDYTAEDSLDAFIERQPAHCNQEALEGGGSAVGLYHMYASDGALEISPVWASMDLDGFQDRIAAAGQESCHGAHQRSDLNLDFPVPTQDVQRTLDLIQTRSSLDSTASAPAPRSNSGMPRPPPRSVDQDVSRSFPPPRPNLATAEKHSTISPQATSRIGSRNPILRLDSKNGASHRPQQSPRASTKTPAAAAPANRKSPTSSPLPHIADLHEQKFDRDSRNHAVAQMECGGIATATASASAPASTPTPVKEPAEKRLQLLKQLPALQELGEEEIMKLLEQVPQHVLGKFMKKTHGARKVSSATAQSTNASGASRHGATNPKSWHHCPDAQCDRKFPRKCELKKHRKRHEKPYCCTFPPCPKRFGSKSDWKRHENTQHYQLEMWACDMKKIDAPTEQCIKKCYRRESFKQHLHKEHHIEDQNKLEEKCEKCRVERHCDSKFWCGFCERSYDVTPQSPQKAQTERANHMDDHFWGRNNVAKKKEISEWKTADPDLPEMDLSSPAEDDEDSPCGSKQITRSSTMSTDNSQESDASGSSQAKSKRRRAENEAAVSAVQEREPKRPRNDAETSQMWLCCQCSSQALVKTTPVCVSGGLVGSRCDHARCDDCQVSSYTPNELKQMGTKNGAARPST